MKLAEREHYGLAVSCAQRFRDRGVPMEDLICEAEAALLWAAGRFDESRGVRFSTYAIPVVLGALREFCRRAGPMYVPRREQRLLHAADKARESLCQSLKREPAVGEIARLVGAPASELGQMLAARERMNGAGLPAAGLSASGLPAAEGGFEDWVLCRELIRGLPRPYAQVLWLRFVVGTTQKEAARRLGVGQPQISRWEKQGRERLRSALLE